MEDLLGFRLFTLSRYCFTIILSFILLSGANSQDMKFNNADYASDWKEVAKFDEQGLPKSALAKVETLYAKAISDNNPSQIIKSLIYKSKYMSQLEEEGFAKAVVRMQEETAASTFPVKPILQSMMGELYSGYLSSNYGNNFWIYFIFYL